MRVSQHTAQASAKASFDTRFYYRNFRRAYGTIYGESDGYLRSIHDDDELVVAPSALASAFAGVELVILFVCSGGRIDKNPWDNSTTSLPKQLLNGGSRAVIASPWPLNVLVTYNWLDPFLRAWEDGATILDATRTANDTVAKHFGDVPQYSLAMRVYGDILLSRTRVNPNRDSAELDSL